MEILSNRKCEHASMQFESAYIHTDYGFAHKNGNRKKNRICLAAELGYLILCATNNKR